MVNMNEMKMYKAEQKVLGRVRSTKDKKEEEEEECRKNNYKTPFLKRG